MNLACPSEDRLKSLIMEAFDELPSADSGRLGQIATTLATKVKNQRNQNSRSRQHWLFWLLLGGSMTAAAWWGSNYLLPKKVELPISIKQEQREPVTKPDRVKPSNKTLKEPTDGRTENHSHHKVSPIIDQREQY